jgi:hypothetical protein
MKFTSSVLAIALFLACQSVPVEPLDPYSLDRIEASATWQALYDGETLDGWHDYGDAIYAADGESILGTIGGGAQSFLISDQSYGDFVLEVDVKAEEPGNSGIQIRSHAKENGRPFGYQIEIDCSDRAWSGGLYDEARRGWLDDLKLNPEGRAAFKYQEWNQFHIEAIGPWIRVCVNGVPTADYFDTMDLEGFFGLQVHSGNNTRVRWRNPKLLDLGERHWIDVVSDEESPWTWDPNGGRIQEIPLDAAESSARHFPVLKFSMHAESGSLHLFLSDEVPEGVPTLLDAVARTSQSDWHVDPQAAPTFEVGEWNAVSVGFDGDSCAVQVNDRSQRVQRTSTDETPSRLFVVCAGDPKDFELRHVMRLGEAMPR